MKQKDSQEIRPADAKEEDSHLAHEALVKARNTKVPLLHDIVIRPAITGRKTIGILECHANGFRFQPSKGNNVDFTFNNIRNAFFQPCEDRDIIVLIHFRLRAPILIGNKKFLDIQFYAEVCNQFEDIDGRKGKNRLTEQDEIIQEKRERELRKRLDDKFQRFCQNSESFAESFKYKLTFDIPFQDLGFTGCHSKANVTFFPTKTSLVSLSEAPFYAIDVNDIEMCHFERVSLSVKNFDMVFIYRDFANFKRISSVPMEQLDMIKDWLNESDVFYTEGPISLNWQAVLSQVRSDIGGFIEGGGWSFLKENDQAESQKSSS